jgi:nitrite reductase (NO-forming) / hydroxylamine reductase
MCQGLLASRCAHFPIRNQLEYPMTLRPPSLRHAALAAAVLALAACGSDPQPTAEGVTGVTDGRAAYLANCVACHQADGGGIRGAFPPLANADWLREHSTQATIEVLLRGLSGPITVNGVIYNSVMPPVAHLSDRDIAVILTYVYGNWGNDGRQVTPEMVAIVRAGGSLPGDDASDDAATTDHDATATDSDADSAADAPAEPAVDS